MTQAQLAEPESDEDWERLQTREDFVKVIETLTEERAIPKELKNAFPLWAFWDKEVTLSKLNSVDRQLLSNQIAIVRNFILMSIPSYKITLPLLMDLENLETKFNIKLTRGDGGFERKQLTTHTQVRQSFTDSGMVLKSGRKPGILNRIFGGGGRRE